MNQFEPDTPMYSRPSPRVNQLSSYFSGTIGAFSNANGLFPSQQPGGTFQKQQPPPATKPPSLQPAPNQQHLPSFNQTASKRQLGVEYTAWTQIIIIRTTRQAQCLFLGPIRAQPTMRGLRLREHASRYCLTVSASHILIPASHGGGNSHKCGFHLPFDDLQS
jgi:hypothetical protein